MNDNIPIKPLETGFQEKTAEILKNELMAAACDCDGVKAAALIERINRYFLPAISTGTLCETDEKLLNQILQLLKKKQTALMPDRDRRLTAAFKTLKRSLVRHIREKSTSRSRVSFDKWAASLNLLPSQFYLLYKTAISFQLTKGCSNFCRRCNEWALPGVRAHFSFDAVTTILNGIHQAGNKEISLYGASDPLDYQDGDRTVADIIDQMVHLPLEYSLLTKLPRGKGTLLKRLLNKEANISVSVTARNKKRIAALERKLEHSIAKHHDTDDLLIPACMDEDFETVKPSITDGYGTEITPDGAFIIIPTFTSALHPFGHKKIRVTEHTTFFPVRKTGRQALLVDYFKPIECYDLDGKRFFPDRLLDVQVESILLDDGRDTLTPPGMRSVKEYFSIFEKKARQRRKSMTVSVLKKLKKRYLPNGSFKDMPDEARRYYLARIRAHMDLCRTENCRQAAKDTAAFFLSAIMVYCTKNPVKKRIIQFLVKQEIKRFKGAAPGSSSALAQVFTDSGTDCFTLFRILALQVLSSDKPVAAVDQFIRENQAFYDPAADIFICPA